MSPADRAKHVVAAFRQRLLSDADLENIIASAITRAVTKEREQFAFMANFEAHIGKVTSDMDLGKGAAYRDMALKIRARAHAKTQTTPAP